LLFNILRCKSCKFFLKSGSFFLLLPVLLVHIQEIFAKSSVMKLSLSVFQFLKLSLLS
jgi:hypothetical protein